MIDATQEGARMAARTLRELQDGSWDRRVRSRARTRRRSALRHEARALQMTAGGQWRPSCNTDYPDPLPPRQCARLRRVAERHQWRTYGRCIWVAGDWQPRWQRSRAIPDTGRAATMLAARIQRREHLARAR